jgi:MFS family permease
MPGRDGLRLTERRGVRAFGHHNYRLFFGGQAISLIGTWMQQVAQAWLVLQLTGDVLWLGVIAAAQFLPILVLGLFAGVLADALPKRRTLLVTQVVKMSLSIALAIIAIANIESIPLLIAIALAIGTANAFDMPVRQSFAVEMVGREDVGNAVALNSAMFNGARIIGPAIAGLTIGAVGVAAAFVIDAVSFLAVIAALLAMRESELHSPPLSPRPHSVGAVWTQLVEGLDYVRRTPLVLMAVIVIGLVSTVAINFSVIIPPYAQDVLHGDASTYGFLMAASGVGSLLAALWLAFGSGARPRRIAIGAVILGISEVALAASGTFAVSLLIMVALGFGAILMAASANTTMQLAVPDGLRGRVMSVYTTIFAGSTPIGSPIMGALASTAGVAVSLAVSGSIAAVVGLAALVWVRRRRLDRPLLVPPSRAGAEIAPAGVPLPAPAPSAARYASGAPSTSAAFNPPKPNEVLNTRR